MALGRVGYATIVYTVPGLIAFSLAIVAENKVPGDAAIQMEQSNGATTCHYPHDSSIALGILSVIFLFVSSSLAIVSLFFPYHGKPVPIAKLSRSVMFVIFFLLSLALFFTSEGLLMWATITESNHRKYNTHYQPLDACPTVKTGLLGGAGFLALDTTLFWLICMMLVVNARVEHYEVAELASENEKGSYAQVTNEYEPAMAGHVAPKV
ncbi:hypothetical protein O6H91_01G080500 [Diphasiastrum complanatum]|uniref:Uncharacterized protein n=2 Tax=Diphasiastrum complanatum TaxID=34168 RepID=A0ACC2ESL7_DIPCM|nr:hypothetical protein O6H91_01G028400 [Diphasiastrum complanatum]KAJ7569486.1 hypothetical protein O6H91_01G080500 [Diphasiastrum complanatum]